MGGRESYRQFIERVERSPEYAADVAALTFAETLFREMRLAGIDTADLAARTGLSQQRLCAVLRGDARLRGVLVHRIAAAFDRPAGARLCQAADAVPGKQTEAL